jgi:hypothetical protein
MSDLSTLPFGRRSATPDHGETGELSPDQQFLVETGLSESAAKDYALGGVSREDIMDADAARRIFEECVTRWRITDDKVKGLVLNSLLAYLCLNSPSPRGNYSGYIEVKGVKYPVMVFHEVVAGRHRQFHRVFVEIGRVTKILQNNPKTAAECAKKFGYPARLAIYAYDTSEYAPGISPQVKEELARYRQNKLNSLIPYEEIKSVQSMKPQPKGISSIDNYEVGTFSRPSAY